MNKNCVFSICAKNYLPLARILGQSITEKSNNVDFFIIIADEVNNQINLKDNELIAHNILSFDDNLWNSLSFKYDVTEFCTFLKPYMFDYFFNKYERVFYLDPDIYFYDSFDIISKELYDCEFLLTPHILYIDNTDVSHKKIEDELRGSGLFNFGFLGLRKTKSTISYIEWWKENLFDKCYRDGVNYLYTDQVWGNYIVTYFDLDKIKIVKYLGWNIAPWNYSEREILLDDGLFVKKRNSNDDKQPVIFVHYSGYNYKALCDGCIEQHNNGHDYIYNDISILFDAYREILVQNKDKINKGLSYTYSYNYFSNGQEIQLFHRRLYRSLLIIEQDVGNPFDSNNMNFYQKLKKQKLLFNNASEAIIRNPNNIAFSNKLNIINSGMRFIFKFLGIKKYLSFMKFLKGYGQFENQLHLMDHKYNILWYRRIVIGLTEK